MTYRLRIEPYHRPFKKPHQTHHGLWNVREGLLIGLVNEKGDTAWGEIAPIPWFGTETVEAAIAFCHSLPSALTPQDIFSVPNTLPACQFGFGSAWEARSTKIPVVEYAPAQLSALLPAGEAALSSWRSFWDIGHRTFKWKMGVLALEQELDLFQTLVSALPPEAKLRLDANGGLTLTQAKQWLDTCDRTSQVSIEYLEQPLPPHQFEAMVQLTQAYRTPLALDESVATLTQLQACCDRGWTGVMVVKPAIIGYPQALRQFLKTHAVDAVFSTAFETVIGRTAALAMAQEFSAKNRAVGFSIKP
jgi:o-succinylbenzoate synthase